MSLPGCHADANDVLELLSMCKKPKYDNRRLIYFSANEGRYHHEGTYHHKDIRILADVQGLPDSQRPTRKNIVSNCIALKFQATYSTSSLADRRPEMALSWMSSW
jgi:hypothetical protein